MSKKRRNANIHRDQPAAILAGCALLVLAGMAAAWAW